MPSDMRVLCIDDDAAFCDLQAHFLEQVDPDIEVETVTDPTAAVDRLDDRWSYECVVCDYDMPGMTGLDVYEAIAEAYPNLPFILHTGKGSEEIASEAISAGVTDYLQKGSGTEHYELLANRIGEYVERYRTSRQQTLTEQRYQRLVEQSVVGIGLSQNGKFEYLNPRFAEIFGYTRDELVGESVYTVIDASDHDRVEHALELRESGDIDSVHYVVTGLDKRGNQIEIEVNGGQVIYDGEPAVLGVIQPLDVRHHGGGSSAQHALSEIRDQLTAIDASIDRSDPDLDTIADAAKAALETIEDHRTERTTQAGVIDIEAGCRDAYADVGVDNLSLTFDADHRYTGDAVVVEELFAGLFAAWAHIESQVEFAVETAPDAFEIRIELVDAETVEAPPDPPEIGRAAEALDADIYIARTEHGIVYLFTGMEAA